MKPKWLTEEICAELNKLNLSYQQGVLDLDVYLPDSNLEEDIPFLEIQKEGKFLDLIKWYDDSAPIQTTASELPKIIREIYAKITASRSPNEELFQLLAKNGTIIHDSFSLKVILIKDTTAIIRIWMNEFKRNVEIWSAVKMEKLSSTGVEGFQKSLIKQLQKGSLKGCLSEYVTSRAG
jgi:hypothetical protein